MSVKRKISKWNRPTVHVAAAAIPELLPNIRSPKKLFLVVNLGTEDVGGGDVLGVEGATAPFIKYWKIFHSASSPFRQYIYCLYGELAE